MNGVHRHNQLVELTSLIKGSSTLALMESQGLVVVWIILLERYNSSETIVTIVTILVLIWQLV